MFTDRQRWSTTAACGQDISRWMSSSSLARWAHVVRLSRREESGWVLCVNTRTGRGCRRRERHRGGPPLCLIDDIFYRQICRGECGGPRRKRAAGSRGAVGATVAYGGRGIEGVVGVRATPGVLDPAGGAGMDPE